MPADMQALNALRAILKAIQVKEGTLSGFRTEYVVGLVKRCVPAAIRASLGRQMPRSARARLTELIYLLLREGRDGIGSHQPRNLSSATGAQHAGDRRSCAHQRAGRAQGEEHAVMHREPGAPGLARRWMPAAGPLSLGTLRSSSRPFRAQMTRPAPLTAR